MPGQTKMIIITTDEDIIRQFSLNKSTTTQVIDLDNHAEQIPLRNNTNDDIISLPFLAELSRLVRLLENRIHGERMRIFL